MRTRTCVALLIGCLTLTCPAPASWAIFCDKVVDRTDDPGAGGAACTAAPNDCSLRGAIASAAPNQVVCLPTTGTYQIASELDISQNLTLHGDPAADIVVQPAGGASIRVFHVHAGVTATIQNLTVRNGVSNYGDAGGGIYNEGTLTATSVTVRDCSMLGAFAGAGIFHAGTLLTLNGCLIQGNTGWSGGGLAATAPTIISNSTFDGNHANGTTASGGGIYVFNGGSVDATATAFTSNDNITGNGGGICAASGTTTTLKRCGLSGNTTHYNGGAVSARGIFIAVNSTFSGNQAGAGGGGIFLENIDSGSHVSFCTLADNTADSDADNAGNGGGLYANMGSSAGILQLKGNAIAGNTDASPAPSPIHPDVSLGGGYTGNVHSLGSNFIGANDGAGTLFPLGNPNGSGDFAGSAAALLDPKFGPLADNGGPTLTHALLPGSPLVNNGPQPCTDAAGNSITQDQRGEPRPMGGRADIGAYESAFGVILAPVYLLLL